MQPSHPGAILKEIIGGLENEAGHPYTRAAVAQGLGITRKALSNILNEKRRINAEMTFGMRRGMWIGKQ